MVTLACAIALAILSFAEAIGIYVLLAKVWRLEDELNEVQALEPVIDGDGRWSCWNG